MKKSNIVLKKFSGKKLTLEEAKERIEKKLEELKQKDLDFFSNKENYKKINIGILEEIRSNNYEIEEDKLYWLIDMIYKFYKYKKNVLKLVKKTIKTKDFSLSDIEEITLAGELYLWIGLLNIKEEFKNNNKDLTYLNYRFYKGIKETMNGLKTIFNIHSGNKVIFDRISNLLLEDETLTQEKILEIYNKRFYYWNFNYLKEKYDKGLTDKELENMIKNNPENKKIIEENKEKIKRGLKIENNDDLKIILKLEGIKNENDINRNKNFKKITLKDVKNGLLWNKNKNFLSYDKKIYDDNGNGTYLIEILNNKDEKKEYEDKLKYNINLENIKESIINEINLLKDKKEFIKEIIEKMKEINIKNKKDKEISSFYEFLCKKNNLNDETIIMLIIKIYKIKIGLLPSLYKKKNKKNIIKNSSINVLKKSFLNFFCGNQKNENIIKNQVDNIIKEIDNKVFPVFRKHLDYIKDIF